MTEVAPVPNDVFSESQVGIGLLEGIRSNLPKRI